MRKSRVKARATGDFAFGTANTGTIQVGIQIEALSTDETGEITAGSTYTWYGFFTEKSEARTLDALEIAGWNGNDGDDFVNLVGLGTTEFEVQFEEEDAVNEQGEVTGTRWRPTFINRGGIAMRDQMDDAAKLAFAQQMRGAILARRGGGQRAQSQRPTQGRPQQRAPQQRQAPPQSRTAQSYQRQGFGPGGGHEEPPPFDDDIPF